MGFPVEDSLIANAEKELGRALPPPLRNRLVRNNGGEIEADGDTWTLHPVWDPTDRKRMGRTANHIVKETERAHSWPDFPEGAVAVATNAYGDHLILRPDAEIIEMWDHETGSTRQVEISWD